MIKLRFLSQLAALLVTFCTGFSHAQSFSGVQNISIPDSGEARVGFSVIGTAPASASFGLEQICFTINHQAVSTLNLILVSPTGREVELVHQIDRSGANFASTCLRGDLPNLINTTAQPPFTGQFRAQGQLGDLNAPGDPTAGTWILLIQDVVRDNSSGLAASATLTFGSTPAQPFKLTESNLPIVYIDTRGQQIPDDPKITARMGIINNGVGLNRITDAPNVYWGEIGIELRGNSSQEFPKKPYSLELRDTLGNEVNRPLLGMPNEADWVMIPNYSDKTMLRNTFTYEISRRMGQYATRSRFVEVIVNGRYMGIYTFMERLKRNNNRVNINKMEVQDTVGNALTGGYIFKLDKLDSATAPGWFSSYLNTPGTDRPFFQYEYPKPEEIAPKQKAYIKTFMDTVEARIFSPNYADPVNGYAKHIDVKSFIDFQILQELGFNVDGYRYSTYLHKLRDDRGGKLRMGPIWDMDIAYGNLNFSFGNRTDGWRYLQPSQGAAIPAWWERFDTDSNYVRQRRCRWVGLRQNVLDTTTIFRIIDSSAAIMGPAIDRNYNWWATLGIYVWPNPRPIATTYGQELDYMKNWLRARIEWMDRAWGTVCNPVFVKEDGKLETKRLALYPNPATQEVRLVGLDLDEIASVRVLDITGKDMGLVPSSQSQIINVSGLNAGAYLVKVVMKNQQTATLRLIKQ